MPIEVATTTSADPTDTAPPATANPARRRRSREVGGYLLLTGAAIVILFPIYISVVDSLLKSDQLGQQPPPFFPFHPQWGNYSVAWTQGHLSAYLKNSAIMTATIVAAQLVTSILAAYAFAFLRF